MRVADAHLSTSLLLACVPGRVVHLLAMLNRRQRRSARAEERKSRRKEDFAQALLYKSEMAEILADTLPILQTKAEFDNTWASASASGAQQDAHAPDATSTKVWKFTAAQLTYNATEGEWASTNKQELRGLFDRVLTFARVLEKSLKAEHLSVKMERSKENHVHIHVYFNLTKAFRAEGPSALAPFTFEGIHPHVVPNKASGGAFAGAVRHGHFYVVADKIGSVFAWTNYHPFTDYAVEGWWLDNLLKQQKMTHEAYLSNAARLGVGFQRRLNDVSAAQRYLKGQAIAQAVQAQADALKEHTFPMKDFPEVDDFLACFQGPRRRAPRRAVVTVNQPTS